MILVLMSVQGQVVKLVSSAVTQVDASQQAGAVMALQIAQMIQMRAAAVSNSPTLILPDITDITSSKCNW